MRLTGRECPVTMTVFNLPGRIMRHMARWRKIDTGRSGLTSQWGLSHLSMLPVIVSETA